MKLSKFCSMAALFSLLLALTVTGCKKTPKGITVIPGKRTQVAQNASPFPADRSLSPGAAMQGGTGVETLPLTESGIGLGGLEDFDDMLGDREFFRSNTIYFGFDRSSVEAAERVKVEEVALYLKGDPDKKLLIEGHCDERGTEEYNRALGERRALAVREFLVNLGISADRIRTLSYGEDKPAVEGMDESAWSKNRRGEFVLLRPKP